MGEWLQKVAHNGILFIFLKKKKKERNSVICNNMDEPGGRYAKWCEPDRERQYHMASLIWGI